MTNQNGKICSVLPYSKKPERLLRIHVSDECNYNCCFCCWKSTQKFDKKKTVLPEPDIFSFILEAIIDSGCKRVMLTGGEPFLIDEDRLLNIISVISSAKGISDFWCTTNGAKLDNSMFCTQLRKNGLKKIVVSVGAETNEKYMNYTRSDKFSDVIFRGLENALDNGIEVKVDIPLSTAGIKNFAEIQILIEKLRLAGVRKIAYFKLHKTRENAHVFNRLFVSSDVITNGFFRDSQWNIKENDAGQSVFSDGNMEIIIPAKIFHVTENCKKNKCGHFCQGIYAAYLMNENGRLFIRACHHSFPDRSNEFEIDADLTDRRDIKKLTEIFANVWKYAYTE